MELNQPPADAPLILSPTTSRRRRALFDQIHVLGFRAIAAYDAQARSGVLRAQADL